MPVNLDKSLCSPVILLTVILSEAKDLKRVPSACRPQDDEPDDVKASTTSGSFPITFTRIVEAHSDGTRFKAIIEGDASGFFKLAEPLLKHMVQRSVEADYRNLKAVAERSEL